MSAEFPDGIEESWRADAAEQEVRRLRAALEKINGIEKAATEYVALRKAAGRLKYERSRCRCENASQCDFESGDPGSPPCYLAKTDDPVADGFCDPCIKRLGMEEEIQRLSKDAKRAWCKLKRLAV